MHLSRFGGVQLLSCLKSLAIIGLVCAQHGEHDPRPDTRQGTNGNPMAFAFRTFAFLVGSSPGLALGAFPGKLMQGVAQWLAD